MPNASTDRAIVAAHVRAAGSSFYWAMRLLPKPKRHALFAVYSFCREVDDIADGDADVPDPVRALETWTARLDDLFDGKAATPLERCLVRAIEDYRLRKDDFLSIIEGMMLDAKGPIQRPDLDALTYYCDCVASAVGRLCIRVFGDASDAAKQLATEQGQALQLTNILRDIEEDAALERIYVPLATLKAHGLDGRRPKDLIGDPALIGVRADLGALAQQRYDAAYALAARCDQVAIRPAMMMLDAYRLTYDQWRLNGWQPPRSRILAKLHKRVFLIRKAIGLWVRRDL